MRMYAIRHDFTLYKYFLLLLLFLLLIINIAIIDFIISSVQFKMVYMRSEKPICAPPSLSEVSPKLPLKRFQCSSD